MQKYVEKTSASRTFNLRLNVITIIRGMLVGIQCLKADDSFKTTFQPQFAKSFGSMDFIRICEYLFFQ